MPTPSLTLPSRRRRALCAALACSLVALYPAQSPAAPGARSGAASPGAGQPAAALEQCVTSVAQIERSATFAGEMTAVAGTARMAMRIEVLESAPGEVAFHAVAAPGLGVWRDSDPRVKIYKYLKQVTNLSAPASYRALVRFRWMGAHGHVIKRAERITPRCEQPAPPPAAPQSAA
jgi:hypothetical protein